MQLTQSCWLPVWHIPVPVPPVQPLAHVAAGSAWGEHAALRAWHAFQLQDAQGSTPNHHSILICSPAALASTAADQPLCCCSTEGAGERCAGARRQLFAAHAGHCLSSCACPRWRCLLLLLLLAEPRFQVMKAAIGRLP